MAAARDSSALVAVVLLFLSLSAPTGCSGDSKLEDSDTRSLGGPAAAAAAVIADLEHLQNEMLQGTELDGKRVVLCKTIAGLGNRIQGIMSCLALAVATRRALVVQWELEVSSTPPHANGLMPCRLEEVLAFPERLDLNMSRAFKQPQEMKNKVVEAFVSQMVLHSGRTPTWGDLLLCTNMTYMLKHTPVLSIPAWRWMPEILSNGAYRSTLLRLFGGADKIQEDLLDPPAFYRTVAPSLIRPAHDLLDTAAALRRYWPSHATTVGIQARFGLATDNKEEKEHFFTPSYLWRSWLRCAYTVLSQEDPGTHDLSAADKEVWFIAADSMKAKVDMMIQMSKEEGGLVSALNLEHVTSKRQHSQLMRQMAMGKRNLHMKTSSQTIPPSGHAWLDKRLIPVVVDFASGARLIFLGRVASRTSCDDVQAAMLEMHVLSWSDKLIASHLSTFAALASASVSHTGIYHVNRDGECFPALSLEPLSDAGDLLRDKARCFSEKHVIQHSWSRPRRRSQRAMPQLHDGACQQERAEDAGEDVGEE
jgi:hypothetical protein